MSIVVNGTILQRRGTTSEWIAANPVLENKEQGYETATDLTPIGMKMGDGVTAWSDLPYWFRNGTVGPPIPNTISSGVTVIPAIFTYDTLIYPAAKYALIRTPDNSYDWNTQVIYDYGSFTINGDDDGTGHFADSFTFWILP